MNERTQVSLSWLVTVVMLPIIGFSGVRMVNGLDGLRDDMQTVKSDQSATNEAVRTLKADVTELRNIAYRNINKLDHIDQQTQP